MALSTFIAIGIFVLGVYYMIKYFHKFDSFLGKVGENLKSDVFSLMTSNKKFLEEEAVEKKELGLIADEENEIGKEFVKGLQAYGLAQKLIVKLSEQGGSRQEYLNFYNYLKWNLGEGEKIKKYVRDQLEKLGKGKSALEGQLKVLKNMLVVVENTLNKERSAERKASLEKIKEKINQLIKITENLYALSEDVESMLRELANRSQHVDLFFQKLIKMFKNGITKESLIKMKEVHTSVGKELVGMYQLEEKIREHTEQMAKYLAFGDALAKQLEAEEASVMAAA